MKAGQREAPLSSKLKAQFLRNSTSLSYRNLMSPTGWAGAFHRNDRFLFRDLSEWVTASASWKQVTSLEWGGMKTKVPAIWWSDTLRAWRRNPMKSRLLLTVTATKTPIQHEHVWLSSVWWFYAVFFKTKSLRSTPRKWTIHCRGGKLKSYFTPK